MPRQRHRRPSVQPGRPQRQDERPVSLRAATAELATAVEAPLEIGAPLRQHFPVLHQEVYGRRAESRRTLNLLRQRQLL